MRANVIPGEARASVMIRVVDSVAATDRRLREIVGDVPGARELRWAVAIHSRVVHQFLQDIEAGVVHVRIHDVRRRRPETP